MDRWQVNKTMTETVHHLFETGKLHDVTFCVNKQPIKAHKLILAARSPVFEAMFCGHIPEGDMINITDLDLATFKELLRYLYIDKCDVTPENVTSLLYGAHKYDIPPLANLCRTFILDKTSDVDVCDTLQQARILEDHVLQDNCMTHIFKRAEFVLKTAGFLALPREILSDIISSDRLEADEVGVYASCRKWAEKHCTERGMDNTVPSLRQALGDILYKIRFPLMKLNSFQKMLAAGKLVLDSDESEEVRASITERKDCHSFNMKHRYYRVAVIQRFNSEKFDRNWVNGGILKDALSFVAYKNASLVGVGIFTPCESGELSGQIQIFNDNNLLLEVPVKLQYTEGKFYEDVMFNHAVAIKKFHVYTVVQKVVGVNSYFGNNGQSTHIGDRITVDQQRSSKSTNGTFEKIGQIPRLFLKVAP